MEIEQLENQFGQNKNPLLQRVCKHKAERSSAKTKLQHSGPKSRPSKMLPGITKESCDILAATNCVRTALVTTKESCDILAVTNCVCTVTTEESCDILAATNCVHSNQAETIMSAS